MLTVSLLRRKPRHFQTFTRLSPVEFDRLLAQVEEHLTSHCRGRECKQLFASHQVSFFAPLSFAVGP